MASSKAPGVILPTVPMMPSSGAPTRATRATSIKGGVVHTPKVAASRSTRLKPAVRLHKPKMPADATRLQVPTHKRLAKTFSTKRKPVL